MHLCATALRTTGEKMRAARNGSPVPRPSRQSEQSSEDDDQLVKVISRKGAAAPSRPDRLLWNIKQKSAVDYSMDYSRCFAVFAMTPTSDTDVDKFSKDVPAEIEEAAPMTKDLFAKLREHQVEAATQIEAEAMLEAPRG